MTFRILCRNLVHAAARCSWLSRRLQPAAALNHQPASRSLVPRSAAVMLLGSAKQSVYVGGYQPLTRAGVFGVSFFFGYPALFIDLAGRGGGAFVFIRFFCTHPPRLALLLLPPPSLRRQGRSYQRLWFYSLFWFDFFDS